MVLRVPAVPVLGGDVGFGRRLVDAEIGEQARAVLEFCQRE
jgi:hypothetical protein